jgi:hypothetical protein
MSNRRAFILQTCIGGAAMAADPTFAKAVMVEESDPQALALGYHADGRNTDKAKYPKYTDGDQCSACTVFQTSVGENSGSCKWFPDKLVAATGWCSAYEIAI